MQKYIERLQFITHDKQGLTHADQVQKACNAGAKWIQYRCLTKGDDELLGEINSIAEICDDWGATLIVTDHFHLAGKADIQGFHIEDFKADFIALRKQLALEPARPETSFGPFKLLHALPWLILAAAMRVIAFGGGAVALPAIIVADISVLLAFFATARQSIEAAGGQSSLGTLTLGEQFKLSFSILWRIMLVMITAALSAAAIGYEASYHLMAGLDGMAFDQFTHPGRFWSAWIAALVLLMIVRAERDDGKVALFAAIGEFVRRGLWLGAAVIVLGAVNVALAYG
ncbi:MAG: hypothetical protein EOP50_19825, partial [Sphingobacteriales bacterium]